MPAPGAGATMAGIMEWQRGFKRIRLVAGLAFALGLILILSVVLTTSLGYAPDPAFVSLFGALWPLGLMLMVLGVLLWVTVWVLSGFLPGGVGSTAAQGVERGQRPPFSL